MRPQTPTQFRTAVAQGPVALLVVVLAVGSGCGTPRLPDPNVVYVAFGDSTTAGPSSREYSDILRELLDAPPAAFANEGEGGENTEEGHKRLQELLYDGLFPNARTLLYWQGGNDVTSFIREHDPFLFRSPADPGFPFSPELQQRLDKTQANIEATIAAARDSGLAVFVATYFSLRTDLALCDALPLDVILPGQAANANAYIVLLNERIRAAAEREGAALVDVAAGDDALHADSANFHDCNHLSAAGNAIVAELFEAALRSSAD